jgi:hypothetical protein
MDGTAGATRGRQLWGASPAWDRNGFVVEQKHTRAVLPAPG